MTSERDAVASVIRRWFEEYWNAGRDEALDELVHRECRQIDLMAPEELARDVWVGQLAGIRAAVPDIRFTIQDVLVEGERAAASWEATGTHTGEGLGMPPTGRTFTIAGMGIATVRDGRLTHITEIWDRPGLMRQLGLG